MLLNMWMIANRVLVLEPELHLEEEEELEIKGVRLYSTESGYLYVYQQEKACVCAYKKEYFILPDVELEIAFGIIQGIFEFYEEWEKHAQDWVRNRDFQKIVDSCNDVLSNPMVILDDNYKVMGMSAQYKANEADGEWQYLAENGYSSIKAVKELRQRNVVARYSPVEERNKIQRIKLEVFGFVNICKFVKYNNIVCGRIVVLEMKRMVNQGDIYFLQKVSDIVAPYIQISDAADYSYTGNSVFNLLLEQKSFDENVLAMQLKYFDWKPDDGYYLFLIDFMEKQKDEMALQLMRIALLKHAKECYTLVHHGKIIVVGNEQKCKKEELLEKIENIVIRNEAECLVGLEVEDIHLLPYLHQQLETYQQQFRSHKENFHYFENFAVDYILRSNSMEEKYYACAPGIRRCFLNESEESASHVDTVKVFLLNQKSLVDTAKRLFVHRNTLIYRLNKAKELMKLDFEEGERCLYYSISIRVLELWKNTLSEK